MQLSDFKTYLKRDFKRTDKDTEIVRAYNDMIVWIASLMPHGNYKYQSYISMVSGQEDYPLPTTLMHLIHPVKYLEGSGTNDHGWPLEHITKEEYDLKYPNPNRSNPNDTGEPKVYTIYSRSILVGPIADSVAANGFLEINWSKNPTAQSSDSDTPDLGTEWEEVLKYGALERLYAGIGMLEESSYWASLYRDAAGNPNGQCKRLFDAERDREIGAVGKVVNNDL